MHLVRAVTPQMLERQSGKIIAVTSAAPLKVSQITQHTARHAAHRMASLKRLDSSWPGSGIQVNAIAQNYVNNDTYYPDDVLDQPKFIEHVKRNVPTNKVGAPSKTAELAAYLASEHCTHMVGQLIPLAGGWTT